MPLTNQIDELSNSLKQYVSINYKLSKLEAIEYSSNLGANAITSLIVGIFGIMFILFFSIFTSFYLSSILKNNYIGFGIVATFYFLVFLTLLLCKKWLRIPIREKITDCLLNQSSNSNG
jgi:hypothetical protein